MYAIKAVYDGVEFKPEQPLAINEQYEVIITFVQPLNKINKTDLPYKRGCMKGKMWMADDFDAPLADFKEYMAGLISYGICFHKTDSPLYQLRGFSLKA